MGQSDRCSDIGSGRSSRLTGKRQEVCLAEWREGVEGFLREVSFSGPGRTCRSSLGRGRDGREMNLSERAGECLGTMEQFHEPECLG